MFVVFFALLVGVMTLRENYLITILLGIFLGCLSLLYTYFSGTEERKKKIYTTTIWSIITIGAVIGAWVRYDLSVQSPLLSKNFIGTGSIEDTYKQGKYIFTTAQGRYILTTQNTYAIQDTLLVMGTFSSGIMPSNEPKEFLDFDYPKWLKMKGINGLIYERSSQKLQPPGNQNKSILGRISKLKMLIQQKTILRY